VDPRRLRIGEWLLALAGLLLVASTFLDWYDVDSRQEIREAHSVEVLTAWGSLSAWEAFTVVDLLIAVLAVMAIATAVMAAAHNTPAVSLALASLTALVGLVVVVALLVRLGAPPSFSIRGIEVPDDDVSRAAGVWVGLGAAVLTTVAAFVAMRDERFPRGARIEVPVEAIPPPEGGTA
jgi:hypothetical protein